MYPALLMMTSVLLGGRGTAPPDPLALAAASDLGLTAPAAAAAGLTAADAYAVLSSLSSAAEAYDAWLTAQTVAEERAVALTVAIEAAAADPFDPQLVSAAKEAAGAHRAAVAQAEAAKQTLLSAGLAGLSSEQAARLRRCINTGRCSLPPEYRVLNWPEDAPSELASAVVAHRRAMRESKEVPEDAARILGKANGEQAVIEARLWLSSERLRTLRTVLGDD